MTETLQPAESIIGTIQTDTFCEGCGYNLHTQAVMRDPRLGILIVRCPECGRYAAVGQTTTAARAWLNRLATILLAWWVFFLLFLFALCALFMGALAYGHMEEMTELHQIGGTLPSTMPVTTYVMPKYQYLVKQIPADEWEQQASDKWSQIFLAILTIILGLVTGGMFSVLLWHSSGLMRLAAFLPPIVGCGFAASGWATDPQTILIRSWGLAHIGSYFLLDLLTIGIGLLLGRRFARGLLRILVPPKVRQHLAFLWIVDGKTLSLE